MKHKIVVGITGASGAIYAQQFLKKIKKYNTQIDEIGIVMSSNAMQIWETELENTDYKKLDIKIFNNQDFSAPFASGSAKYNVMVIIPCSMGTLGRIAQGISNDLLTRAADVILKEKSKLILVVRETPYNLIHIKNMESIILAGGIICPASPSFYHKPNTIEQLVDTVVDRALDLSGIEIETKRWNS